MAHDNLEASTGRLYGGWIGANPQTIPSSRFGILSSYYYRYRYGQGAAKIDTLATRAPAAMWDSYHSSVPPPGDCCGNLNPGYHRKGYNIAFYDGTVGVLTPEQYNAEMSFLPGTVQTRYPTNIWLGWTDLKHTRVGITGGMPGAMDAAWQGGD